MPRTDQKPPDRIAELDSVRGLAALAVLIFHLGLGFWFGATGVDLFFVLSGYLITSIIIKNCERPHFLKVFYIRRSLRIFPIYYLTLFVVYGLNSVRANPFPTDGYVYYLFYGQNIPPYWGGAVPSGPSVGHTWTLAIEEQFYLLWPFAILLLGRIRAIWLCTVLIVLPIVLRWHGLSANTLFAHTDGLAWGGLLAYAQWRWPWARSPRVGLCLLLVFIAGAIGAVWTRAYFMANGDPELSGVGLNPFLVLISLAYFGLIGFVSVFAGSRYLAFLRLRPLMWFGTISYGLYLYHWPVYETLDTIIMFGMNKGDPWWLSLLKFAATVVVAQLSWTFIEKPILRLKDRAEYRVTRRPANESTASATQPVPEFSKV